jgi:hypothetical protein
MTTRAVNWTPARRQERIAAREAVEPSAATRKEATMPATATSIATRLRRLEGARPPGCDCCRAWTAAAVVDTCAPPHRSRPEICPGCGRRVPITRWREVGACWAKL